MKTKPSFQMFFVMLCSAFLAVASVRATEICPTNSGGPDICVDWNGLPPIPIEDFDFEVDYVTDAANPTVILKAGAAWNVRSKDNAGNPGNIGDIKIDATVVTDSFDLAITDNSGGFGVGGPGASNVGSILLSDLDPLWTGHSSITAKMSPRRH